MSRESQARVVAFPSTPPAPKREGLLQLARLCLDHADRPAWLVTRGGEVLHANRHARRAPLDTQLAATFARGRSPPSDWSVETLSLDGETLCLVVRTSMVALPEERVRAARGGLRLTARQAEVLELVGAGLANKEIAERLGCAVVTVEAHVTSLLRKSGATSRGQLTAWLWTGALVSKT